MDTEDLDIRSLAVGHLPLVRACMEQLGIFDVLDDHLPRHTLAKASDAECVAAMVLNILSGRVALWRMDQCFEHIDLELILGEGVKAEWFHDNRLGRALDHIDQVGTDTLLSAVALRYLQNDDSEPFAVHLDHTSLSLYGQYIAAVGGPLPAHGHSKDHRPDLKQLVFGLSLHGSVGIPLTMSLMAGNTSDHVANRDHLSRLAELLPNPDAVTIVDDCKLVDGETLGRLTRAGFHFVSLIPKTVSTRQRLISQAWSEDPDATTWPVLASKAPEIKGQAPRLYRGRSFVGDVPFRLAEDAEGTEPGQGTSPEVASGRRSTSGKSTTEPMRCLVVRSDSLAKHFEESLPNKLAREVEQFKKLQTRVLSKTFACEADARAAMSPLVLGLAWHRASVVVERCEVVEKRASKGRPRKDAPPPQVHTVWVPRCTLEPDLATIDEQRRQASCFVLVTDWGEDEWDDQRVLAEYRHQSLVEGHTGFRWLKGPAAVSPMFLETPTRIRALGFVFMLALMVRNFIQFRLREAIRKEARPIPHPLRRRRLVSNLTTEMAMVWFEGVCSIAVRVGAEPWARRRTALSEPAREILALLGIDPEVFSRPPHRWKMEERAG